MNKKLLIGGGIAGLLVFGAGSAAGSAGGVKDDVAKPAPTVTVTAAPVEKRVEVVTSPPGCVKAIDLQEQVISYAADALGISQQAMQAASRLDANGIYAQKDKMDALMPKLEALKAPSNAAKAECRAAAK